MLDYSSTLGLQGCGIGAMIARYRAGGGKDSGKESSGGKPKGETTCLQQLYSALLGALGSRKSDTNKAEVLV